jgi:LPXTG-motif cell wall-anchored protein
MEESHEKEPGGISQSGLGRRGFLLKAGAAGAAAWAVPSIITMQPAGAVELTSPPPKPPAVEVLPNVATHGAEPDEAAPAAEVLPARTGLPATGAEIGNLAAAGLAAIAGGAALHVWSAKRPDSFAGPDAEAPPALPLP